MLVASQKISLAMLALLLAVCAATLWAVPAEWLLYWLIALGGLTAFGAYVFLGSPLVIVLVWFFTLTCLDEEFARLILPGFFNLTIPRVFIAVIVLVFLAMLAAGRFRVKWAWPTSGLFLLILVYFTISAAVSGFRTDVVPTVHYRLIAGYVFPFIVFMLLIQAIHTDRDIHWLLAFFFGLGLYLTLLGWAERFELWQLVWPRFVADPTIGIHWGRVRGPFLASPIMGLALVYVFFNNLVLGRMSGRGFRLLCHLASLAVLPVIFWTETRSVWLAMIAAGLLWFGLSQRRMTRVVSISVILAIAVAGVTYNWRNILSERREVGGVTDRYPIYVRLGLILITWDMFKDRPFLGVGFGHFRVYGPDYARNPSSPYYAFASTAMEHNNFLSILAECGLVGLLLYVWLLLALLRVSLRLYRRLPPMGAEPISRDLVVLYWILYADFIADAMFRETSVSPFANALFFGLSAVVFALDHMLGPEPFPEASASDGAPATAPTFAAPTAGRPARGLSG